MGNSTTSEHTEALRKRLMQNVDSGDVEHMQRKADLLTSLARLDGSHDHDSGGGVGHHDHEALADLGWRLKTPNPAVTPVPTPEKGKNKS